LLPVDYLLFAQFRLPPTEWTNENWVKGKDGQLIKNLHFSKFYNITKVLIKIQNIKFL
jgi:hypothetical protein